MTYAVFCILSNVLFTSRFYRYSGKLNVTQSCIYISNLFLKFYDISLSFLVKITINSKRIVMLSFVEHIPKFSG